MATITEDYVSLETAKLLNDKGFGEPTIGTYNIESKNPILIERPIRAIHCEAIISAPTLQMAMKWLREVHHLYIDVGFGNDYKGEFLYMGDIYDLTKDAIYAKYKPIIEADDYLFDNPKNYEEACEAAIKYCLENLIEKKK